MHASCGLAAQQPDLAPPGYCAQRLLLSIARHEQNRIVLSSCSIVEQQFCCYSACKTQSVPVSYKYRYARCNHFKAAEVITHKLCDTTSEGREHLPDDTMPRSTLS